MADAVFALALSGQLWRAPGSKLFLLSAISYQSVPGEGQRVNVPQTEIFEKRKQKRLDIITVICELSF